MGLLQAAVAMLCPLALAEGGALPSSGSGSETTADGRGKDRSSKPHLITVIGDDVGWYHMVRSPLVPAFECCALAPLCCSALRLPRSLRSRTVTVGCRLGTTRMRERPTWTRC